MEPYHVKRRKTRINYYRIEDIDTATELENIRLVFLLINSILTVGKLIENEKNNITYKHCQGRR